MERIDVRGVNPTKGAPLTPSITAGETIESIDSVEPQVVWWYLEEIINSNKIGLGRKMEALERTLTYYRYDTIKQGILLRSVSHLSREPS